MRMGGDKPTPLRISKYLPLKGGGATGDREGREGASRLVYTTAWRYPTYRVEVPLCR